MKTKMMLVVGMLSLIDFGPSPRAICDLRADDKVASDKNQPALSELDPDFVVEMTRAAEDTLEAYEAAYNAGTARSTDVCIWSRRLLDGQRALAKTHAEKMADLRAHRERMKNLFMKVNALYIEGVKGGEAERFDEVRYYLAEATALVEQATPPEERGPARVEVTFSGPEGMHVQWDESSQSGRPFDSEPLVCPASHEFRRGRIYRMMFTRLPGFKGIKAHVLLELIGPSAEPVPVGLGTSDAEALAKGGGGTRVIYAPADRSEIQSIRGNGNTLKDDIAEAERKGTVLAILYFSRAR